MTEPATITFYTDAVEGPVARQAVVRPSPRPPLRYMTVTVDGVDYQVYALADPTDYQFAARPVQ